jgi:hypothetical protein
MVKIQAQKTTELYVNSDDFNIVVKKMLFWQRQNGMFENDEELEFKEYEWRRFSFFYGHRTDFKFSNGIENSLIVLHFLPALVPVEEEQEEIGSHREYMTLICEVRDGHYELVSNEKSYLCIHKEEH